MIVTVCPVCKKVLTVDYNKCCDCEEKENGTRPD